MNSRLTYLITTVHTILDLKISPLLFITTEFKEEAKSPSLLFHVWNNLPPLISTYFYRKKQAINYDTFIRESGDFYIGFYVPGCGGGGTAVVPYLLALHSSSLVGQPSCKSNKKERSMDELTHKCLPNQLPKKFAISTF